MNAERLDAAVQFIWRHARLLERRRFSHDFMTPDPDGVAAAVLAYRNADGGFGNALEPDCRTPHSQPEPTRWALEALADVGRLDGLIAEGAAAWCESVAAPEGGLPFCLKTVEGYPRAPWWQPEEAGNINPTAGIVGVLRASGTSHPWLDRVEAWCWDRIEAADAFNQYELHNVAAFCEGVGERNRADTVLSRVREALASGSVIPLDPSEADPNGDTHTPLQLAPLPEHPLRRAFSDEVIGRFLEALEAGQQPDGGWSVGWPAPGETAVLEWRGVRTLQALQALRAYGRL